LRELNLGKTNHRVSLRIYSRFVFAPSLGLVFISNVNPSRSCVYICKFQFRPIHPPLGYFHVLTNKSGKVVAKYVGAKHKGSKTCVWVPKVLVSNVKELSHPVLEGKPNANHVRARMSNSRTQQLHNWTSSHSAQIIT
jgi:hypothetical protein